MARRKTEASSPVVEQLRLTMKASRDRLRERGEGSHTLAEWFRQLEAIREPDPPETEAAVAAPEPRPRPLTIMIAGLPSLEALEPIMHGLRYFPPVANVTLAEYSEDCASLELVLSQAVSGLDIVAALEESAEQRLLIMETLPDKLRLQIGAPDAATIA